jgi:hypothetical protein
MRVIKDLFQGADNKWDSFRIGIFAALVTMIGGAIAEIATTGKLSYETFGIGVTGVVGGGGLGILAKRHKDPTEGDS